MEKTSLTFQTFRNISYNVIGYIWPMLFSLFVTPIIIYNWGVKTYGIYLFVNAIISLFGLMDLGLGPAVIKHMSYYYGKKDSSAITILTHSANSLFLIIGAIGFIISAAISLFGHQLLSAQFTSYQQYGPLFLIGGAIFLINSASNTYTIILTASQRFDISNKISVVFIACSSLSMLAIVLLGGSLTSVFLSQLVLAIVFAGVFIYQAKKLLPQATLHLGWNIPEVKHCYRFGLGTFINGIASTALSSLDRLIIPFYVGPSNLTYYSVPGNVTNRIPGMSNTLAATMFPTTSQLDGANSTSQIETLYVRSFRLITTIGAALTITSIAFAHQLLFYWLNADFANKSTDILVVLACTNFILALFGPLSSFLLGLGKLKFLTIMSVIMGIINALCLVILLPRYGITGAAWAYLISVLPVIYVFYYTEKKYLTLSNRGHYYIKKTLGTLATSGIVWAVDAYALSHLIISLPTLLLVGGISMLTYLIVYRLLGFFAEEDWKDIERFIFALIRKVAGKQEHTTHI